MPLEFPAVSQSRVEFWGKPQYTQKGMLLFTILFGFFGLHHFYLRSPQTGLMILFVNLLTLGYPYFFDILQLATKSHEELQEKGLDLPWSPAGIAQGMWIDPKNPDTPPIIPKGPMTNALKRFGRSFVTCEKNEQNKQQGGGEEENSGPPAPHWFLLYSLLLPLAPLARYIAGDTDNALLGLLNLTIIPLGWLFLAVSIASEYWTLFAKPADLLYNGIYRAFPFTKFGYAETGFSQRLTGHVAEQPVCEDDSVFIRVFKGMYRTVLPAPIVAAIDTVPSTVQTVKTQVIDRGLQVAQNVKEKVETVVSTTGKVANLATQVPSAIASAQQKITNATSPTALQNIVQKRTNLTLPVAATLESFGKQNGGGGISLDTKDKVVTGGLVALLLGGFVLHTGRSAWNAIQDVRSESDLPPSSHA
jgi:hypothetical protein